MRILSLDMSTKKTGWAIFNNNKLEAYNLIEDNSSDISERITNMCNKIQELITSQKIQCIVCEDVPVSQHSNLEVGKNLCLLQGCLFALVSIYKLKFYRLKPTEWRAKIGVNHTEYICKKCGYVFEDISGIEKPLCIHCGNNTKTGFEKNALNSRNELKERAVNMANNTFNLNLKYINNTSKKNEDDIAEAVLIGYSFLKGNDIDGR